MTSWNKHGGLGGGGASGPPGPGGGGKLPSNNNVGGNPSIRRGQRPPSGEDGEIGEEEGEIIGGSGDGGGFNKNRNNNNNSSGKTSPIPMIGGNRLEHSGPAFPRGGGGGGSRRSSWGNSRGGGRGGNGPPQFTSRGTGRPMGGRSYSGQMHSLPTSSLSSQHAGIKPEPIVRAQTFSGIPSSSHRQSSMTNTNPPPPQPLQHQNASAGSGVISRGVSTGSAPARPTDPRFRGNDPIGGAAGNRLPPITEGIAAPPPASRGMNYTHQQQQSSMMSSQTTKEISGTLSTPRDTIRRANSAGNRLTYNSLADTHASNESNSNRQLPPTRREPPVFHRSGEGILSADEGYSVGVEGGLASPRRSTSRTINNDAFNRDEDGSSSSNPLPSSSLRIQTTRSESNTFRGLADLSDSSFMGRTRPSTPSTRDWSRTELYNDIPLPPNDGGSHTTRPQREPIRSSSQSSEIVSKEYTETISKSNITASTGSGASSLSRGPPPPPPAHRDTSRGTVGRRSSDFRIANGSEDPPFRSSATPGLNSGEGSSLRMPASADPSDSYFNNSSGGASSAFRRSPQQRRATFGIGRDGGGLPPPPIGRSGSFNHRRNDPRFSSTYNYDQDRDSTVTHNETLPIITSTDDQKQQSFAKLADGDPFGRTREWGSGGSRRSPQSSPMNRRIPLGYNASSSPHERTKLTAPTLLLGGGVSQPPMNVPLVNEYSSMSYTRPTTGSSPSATLPVKETPKEIEQSIDQAALPVSNVEDAPPPPMFTSAIGENNIKRGENVIGEVVELLECFDLKATGPGELYKLPSKQQILKSIAMMDAKIKEAQKVAEEKKQAVNLAIKNEEEIRAKTKEEALSEAKRQEDQRVRREEELRFGEEKALESEIEFLTKQKIDSLTIQKAKNVTELESKLRTSREQEELKLKENLNQQIVLTADNFDKDIVKIRKDLDKTKQIASRTETKLTSIEDDYKTKVERAEKCGSSDKEPRTEDLIAAIFAENQRRAAEAHMFQSIRTSNYVDEDQFIVLLEEIEARKDPKRERTIGEWAQLTQLVSGPTDALYTEPSQAPYFKHNEQRHALLEPFITEYIRDKETRLLQDWTNLAEEYEFRRHVFEKALPIREKKTTKSSNLIERYSILGDKPQVVLESNGGRTAANPYRRPRRGNEVRSEYEQEQVIAELAEKEALQKRISCGGCLVPRQRTELEQNLTCTYVSTFVAQKVDMVEQEKQLEITNVWTDMEKCIFLDRFMQHPKDFRKLASFLRNKTTADCIRFYYDSKQSVPYKHALREHIMRRKRRGDYHIWDATVEAALSVGARIEAGVNEEKPLVFRLPEDDHTYFTYNLHPMKREIFDMMDLDESTLGQIDEVLSEEEEPKKNSRQRKRPREPLFVLETSQRKFLKNQETSPPVSVKKSPVRSTIEGVEIAENATHESSMIEAITNEVVDGSNNSVANESELKDEGGMTPARKAPQKWTTEEKKIFIDTLGKHGRNWTMLSQAVGTKSISQIKNYYYDYKKQVGKGRIEKKISSKQEFEGSSSFVDTRLDSAKSREDDSTSPPPQSSAASSPPETPMAQSMALFESNDKKGHFLMTDTIAEHDKNSNIYGVQESSITLQETHKDLPEGRTSTQDGRTVIQDGQASMQSMQDGRTSMQDKRTTPHDRRSSLQDGRSSLQDRRTSLQGTRTSISTKSIDQRTIDQWSMEQRINGQRSMEEMPSSTGQHERGATDLRALEQREMDQRLTERRSMEQRSLVEQRIIEQRLMEQRRMEQRGDVQANSNNQQSHDASSYTWPLSAPTSAPAEKSELNVKVSGPSSSDHLVTGSEAWSQALLQSQQMNEDAAARRLLQQHHSHSQHHQQLLSSLLPWVSSGQQIPAATSNGGGLHDFMRLQHQTHAQRPSHHAQQLHTQHIQHQQQHQNHHQQQQHIQQRQAPPQQLHPHHLQQVPLNQQQQHHQHQLERQLHTRQSSQQNPISNVGNASLNTFLAALSQHQRPPTDEAHLALAQHLLALQGDGGSGSDAFGLLGRSLPNNGSNSNKFPGPGNQGHR
jgi:Myb-like DNA-binding domain